MGSEGRANLSPDLLVKAESCSDDCLVAWIVFGSLMWG